MAKLQLALLGGFEARTDSGRSLAMSRKKAQMLLAYLALHPTQTHLRDKLATLLWDDAPAEQARLSLRQMLFAIRQALPVDPMLIDGDSVAVAAEAVTVVVREFEQTSDSVTTELRPVVAARASIPPLSRTTLPCQRRAAPSICPSGSSGTPIVPDALAGSMARQSSPSPSFRRRSSP
jgi:hypothetical protein